MPLRSTNSSILIMTSERSARFRASGSRKPRSRNIFRLPRTIFTYVDSQADDIPLPKAPAGAPNVLLILLDDVGFGQTSTFGGAARTPTLQRLADQGLRVLEQVLAVTRSWRELAEESCIARADIELTASAFTQTDGHFASAQG
jgi:Sulfatase